MKTTNKWARSRLPLIVLSASLLLAGACSAGESAEPLPDFDYAKNTISRFQNVTGHGNV